MWYLGILLDNITYKYLVLLVQVERWKISLEGDVNEIVSCATSEKSGLFSTREKFCFISS